MKLKSLERLYLFGNEIDEIQNNTFEGLVKLEILLLNHNFIENSDFLLNKSLNQLKILNLSSNKLKELPDCFELIGLNELDLSNNKINDLNFRNLRGIKNLKDFYLNKNVINDLKSFKWLLERYSSLNALHIDCSVIIKNKDLVDAALYRRNFENIFINYLNLDEWFVKKIKFQEIFDIKTLEKLFSLNMNWDRNRMETFLVN